MNSWQDWQNAIFGKVNLDYRTAFLGKDKAQVKILVVVATIWAFGYIFIEFLDLQLTHNFFYLLTIRTLFIGGSIALYIKFPKIDNVDRLDTVTLIWSVACVFMAFASNTLRNDVTIKNTNANQAWVLGFYILIPNRHLYKIAPALLISFIGIYSLVAYETTNFDSITSSNLLANIFATIAMNIIGLLISMRLDSQRYHQYLIQKTLVDGRAQLKELAITDTLTRILNRRGFLEKAELEFDRYKRYGKTFTFVMIDLDRLKMINDTQGHPVGDMSIQRLVEIINQEKRSTDLEGRLAGDEFGLLLPNTEATKAVEVLTRIKNMLEKNPLELADGQKLQVRFSAGLTQSKSTDQTFDDIYRRADRALLSAKNKGRNLIEKA